MNTRLIESKMIIRNTVNRVKYLKQEGKTFIFKTEVLLGKFKFNFNVIVL